jgi:hypothetical protein
MVKTYCVLSISQILDRTGEFYHHTQKRYDDTALIIAEILKWGYNSDRGNQALQRMNAIHGHYQISNEDFLYVLSTFIYEPIRWNQRFGWRLFTESEKLAIFYFWQEVGKRMAIHSLPPTYAQFAQYKEDYEAQKFSYAETNHRVGEANFNLFLSWFPPFSHPLLKPCLYALFTEQELRALGWENPPILVRNLVENSLKIRGQIAKLMLPRTQSEFFTDTKLRSYPQGYDLEDLGPPALLDKLNRHSDKPQNP